MAHFERTWGGYDFVNISEHDNELSLYDI
jgi:uncharacterized protein with GYD domain